MTRVVRAGDLIGMPVITLDEAVTLGEVRDVLFDPLESAFVGFTVRGRGLLSPPLIGYLPADAIAATGEDAVMIETDSRLVREHDQIEQQMAGRQEAPGNEIVTEGGQSLGTVSDVVLEIGPDSANVVGYCLTRENGRELIVPAPAAPLEWSATIVVPDGIERRSAEGIAGFSRLLQSWRIGDDPISQAGGEAPS